MTSFRTKTISMLAGMAMLAGTSGALAIDATDPAKILSAMQEYGFAATLEQDSEGDPLISSRISKTKFRVFFFGCDNNTDCSSIHFRAGYNLDKPISALVVNEWNRQKRFGKAYIDDEGDPFLEMDVNMAFEGLGEENFQDTLDWWRVVVEGFEEFIDW